jgi:hypothetical protein
MGIHGVAGAVELAAASCATAFGADAPLGPAVDGMMTSAEIATELPRQIADGLETGAYERLGGAIREVDTGQVIAFVREAYGLGQPIVSELLSLSAMPANANALNLALTTMQFAVVMKRLETIEAHLRQAQKLLSAIDHKLDLSFYANFRAALDLAANAFTMANPETRRVSALQAIARFLEAEHHYTDLVHLEIASQSEVADDYLATLCLAYVTEVRCYLELDEPETALQRLGEGIAVLRPRFEKHARTLLTSNPAAYLHPRLRGRIDLKRLTRVQRWLTPGLDENAVFEAQRDNLFRLAQRPEEWIESLPPAIRLPVKSAAFSAKLFSDAAARLADYVESSVPGVARRRFPWPERERQPKPASGENADPFGRLPETLELIELMIEQCSRFEGYLAELRAVRDSGMAFQQWQGMAPAESPGALGLFYVLVARSPA